MRYNGSMAIRYWLGVVHRDHALRGVAGGFVQVNHGARAPLEALCTADGFVFYSPRTATPDGDRLQQFTAVGRVADDEVYQAATPLTAAEGIRPWRRRVDWEHDVVAVPIRPLLRSLDFTRDQPAWGYQLRRGLIELTRHDFDLIRRQLRSEPGEPGTAERGARARLR